MRAGRGTPSDDTARDSGGFARVLLPLVLASLLGCGSAEKSRNYGSAAEATAAEDWPRAAELWFEVHQDEDPKTQLTYRETARALYESGDAPSACAMLDQALREFPEDLELMEFKAGLLNRCGYHRAAEIAYVELLTLDPDHLDALAALGRLRLLLGLERAAEEPLRHAVEIDSDDPALHACLGSVYSTSMRPVRAFESYSRAIELGCEDPVVLLDASALALRLTVVTRVPDARIRALAWLDQLCEIDPQCTLGHYLRGVYLADLQRTDEAVTALRRAVETDPACLEALERLARIYVGRGELENAEEMVTRALEIERDPERRAELQQLVAKE